MNDSKDDSTTSAIPTGWRGVGASAHLVVAVLVGIAVGLIVAFTSSTLPAGLIGWLAATVFYVLWVWASLWPLDAAATQAVALREDPARGAVRDLSIALVASGALLTVVLVIFRARETGVLLTVLGVASITASWVVVHTIMTARYARLYFASPLGGIDFGSHAAPTFRDFAYMSFTVGMTFQVSDTQVTHSRIRAAVLAHALLSFIFATFIVAVTVNLVAGLGH